MLTVYTSIVLFLGTKAGSIKCCYFCSESWHQIIILMTVCYVLVQDWFTNENLPCYLSCTRVMHWCHCFIVYSRQHSILDVLAVCQLLVIVQDWFTDTLFPYFQCWQQAMFLITVCHGLLVVHCYSIYSKHHSWCHEESLSCSYNCSRLVDWHIFIFTVFTAGSIPDDSLSCSSSCTGLV